MSRIWVCLLVLLAAFATPLRGQAGPSIDYVILKADDLSAERVRLTIIEVANTAEATAVQQKLQSRVPFDVVASQYSKHPSAASGGEFGVFPLADLRPEFRAALAGVKPGGYTAAFAVQRPAIPPDWPEHVPPPGASINDVEQMLGRAYAATTIHADGQSIMTELTYPFGIRLRVHERRGVGFIEFTGAWKSAIFGIRPDDPLPGSIYDLFPRTGRFIRGVFVAVPGHPNWFVDIDDRVEAVTQLLFVDRGIYGDLPGLPKSQ